MHPWDLGNIFIFNSAQSMGISVRFVSVPESDKSLSLHKRGPTISTKIPWSKFWLCTILSLCSHPPLFFYMPIYQLTTWYFSYKLKKKKDLPSIVCTWETEQVDLCESEARLVYLYIEFQASQNVPSIVPQKFKVYLVVLLQLWHSTSLKKKKGKNIFNHS